MKNIKVVPVLFDTYIAIIKNSVGSKIFRNSYAKVNGKKEDILRNGKVSCAFFVSSILALFPLFKLVKYPPHGTVSGTIKDLKESGWKSAKGGSAFGGKKPKVGSILVWEKIDTGDKEFHGHIGFYIGNNKAISMSDGKKTPEIHHWTYGVKKGAPARKIEAIFWNNKLN
ncbi:CHAP domain-containing protein [Candidatus Azambacteria bacterium]|nr:CHAP domain-containing protein [Candidatus Azambacteria bacterium]